ncbi:unnamed protein product [Agarophyton chilense]
MAFLAPQPVRTSIRLNAAPFLHTRSPRHNARPRSRNKRRAASIQCLSGRELAGVAVRTSEKALESLDAKRVASWVGLALALFALRSFFPVILGTFILGYVTNSVVRWVSRLTAGRAPRRLVVGVFYAFIVTAISSFTLMTIPTVVREGQYFISTIQSENPYVYVANTMRKTLGDDLTTKLEAYVMTSVEMPEATAKGTLPSKPASLAILDNKDADSDIWTEDRSRRLGILLQKSIRSYIAATIALITRLLGASTKVIFKAVLSLIFSFMIMWDLPVISRGVKRLKSSRLSFAYDELAPVVAKFGSVVGKSFEAQGLIAIVNTALTTAGLLVLSIPGVGFLSVVTLVCSFIPVAGVFVSTLPMCIIALSEYGVAKPVAVIVMVILVHLIEAYVLNPQIYSAHLHLHPFMVLVVLYIAEHSYGIPGLLMAVPVAVYILRTIMTDDADQTPQALPAPVISEQNHPVPK